MSITNNTEPRVLRIMVEECEEFLKEHETPRDRMIRYALDLQRSMLREGKLTVEVERLRKIEAAQLAELEAISAALGTNEGHSSVHHIERLRAEVERLQNELAKWMNHWRTKL